MHKWNSGQIKIHTASRTMHTFQNLIFGIISKSVNMLGPFLTRIMILRTLGDKFLGISGVFSSILIMLSLSELGFGSAITYKLYGIYAVGDIQKIQNYLSFYKKVYKVIGFAVFLIGMLLVPFLKSIIREDLPSEINIYVIYVIYLTSTVISYLLYGYKSVLLTVSQRQDIESRIAAGVNSITYILQLLLLLLFHNYYIYLFMVPAANICLNIIRAIIVDKLYPDMKEKGDITAKEKDELKRKILALTGHRIAGTVILSADNIVISIFLGVSMVATYNNYYMISNSLMGIVLIIYDSIRPSIGNSLATESLIKNYHDFKNISFMMLWITGWMGITMACLFQDFITIAYGQEYILNFSTVLLLSFEFIIWKSMDVLAAYRDGAGAWSGDICIPYISSAFNLIANIILIQVIGINGVILSTILSFLLFSIPASIKILVGDVFHQNILHYVYFLIKKLLAILFCGIITCLICSIPVFGVNSGFFLIKLLICITIPNLIMIGMFHNNAEYQFLKNRLQYIKSKICK